MKTGGGPLEGVRVLDLTLFWAGPLPAAILADLGAEVIKVESIRHLDPFRAYGMTGGPAVDRSWERSPLFNAANRNKLGLTLDLATEKGRALFLQLVERSHAVIQNYSPRVLPQLGLDEATLRRTNQAIVVTSISGFGQTGPWRDYVSFATIGEALSGISHLTGYEDEGVLLHGVGVSDPYAGLTAAFATIAALRKAEQTGEGSFIDCAQLESSLQFVADAFMERSLTGRVRGRATNEQAGRAPHGCFAAAGKDEWVTISVGEDREWEALVRAMGKPAWAEETRFATPVERCRNRHELNALVEEWTKTQEKGTVMSALQAEGIPSAAVLAPAEQLSDPELVDSGFFQTVDHPVAGAHPYPSFPARFGGRRAPIHKAGPTLGGDNRHVLKSILGLDDAEIQRLEAEGVIGTEPAGGS